MYESYDILKIKEKAGIVSAFHIKEKFKFLPIGKEEAWFDGAIAAYLLNPLKNDYTYEDVAREQLNLIMEDKVDEYVKICYEAYTAFSCVEPLTEKLQETEMWKLFKEIEMPLVFTLYDMEQNGVKVEAEELKIYWDKLAVRIVELEK